MKILYSKHIKDRLRIRGIDYNLPKEVFEVAIERYLDLETGYLIAIAQAELYNRLREVMVAYVMEDDCAKLITIHPLKAGQKENRIQNGRWRKI